MIGGEKNTTRTFSSLVCHFSQLIWKVQHKKRIIKILLCKRVVVVAASVAAVVVYGSVVMRGHRRSEKGHYFNAALENG
jgi:hypothetical protein